MKAIFRDVGQALHFAFVIEQYPAGSKSSLVRAARESMGVRRDTGIDFGDMSVAEMHAECAAIRRSVWENLASHEAAALVARMSHDEVLQQRARLIVAAHFRPALSAKTTNAVLIDSLIDRHYLVDGAKTVRQLGEIHGVSKDHVQRLAKLLEQHISQLDIIAKDNLRRKMEAKNLVAAARAI